MKKSDRFLALGALAFVLVGGLFTVKSLSDPSPRQIEAFSEGDHSVTRVDKNLVRQDLLIPLPAEGGTERNPLELEIEFGAGDLVIDGAGETAGLLGGTILYDPARRAPRVEETRDGARLSQGKGGGGFAFFDKNKPHEWNLQLTDKPLNLEVAMGAARGRLDLGGTALRGLQVDQGAGDFTIDFSSPTRGNCEAISIDGGASRLVMKGIAQSGVSRFTYDGGAGFTQLDFSGTLRRDMQIEISTGVSRTEIILPREADILVRGEVSLGSLDMDKDFVRDESSKVSRYQGGGDYSIELDLDAGLGSVEIDLR